MITNAAFAKVRNFKTFALIKSSAFVEAPPTERNEDKDKDHQEHSGNGKRGLQILAHHGPLQCCAAPPKAI